MYIMKYKTKPPELGKEAGAPNKTYVLIYAHKLRFLDQQSRYLPVCALNIFKMVSIFFIILVHFFTEQRHSIPGIKLYICSILKHSKM